MNVFKYLKYSVSLFVLALALLTTGCDGGEDLRPTYPLNFLPGFTTPVSGDETAQAAPQYPLTRSQIDVPGADPSKKFRPYVELYPQPINKAYTTIGVFLVTDDENSKLATSGDFFYKIGSVNKWESTVGVKEDDYFIFGHMPSRLEGMKSKVEKRTGETSWSAGAVMTIQDLPTVTPADVCVVVGVTKADPDLDIKDQPAIDSITTAWKTAYTNAGGKYDYTLRQGQYAYEGTQTNNYVYLLLDHIYTNVNMEMMVEKSYSELRTIVLRQVRMEANQSKTSNVTIELTNDAARPMTKVTVNQNTQDPPSYAVLFPEGEINELQVAKEGEKVADADGNMVQKFTSIPGYFAPGLNNEKFKFEFTYDVYDGQNIDKDHPFGNLVRKNCVAKNTWQMPASSVIYGKKFRVKVTLKPTYLYQLSEPDLDNPTCEMVTLP